MTLLPSSFYGERCYGIHVTVSSNSSYNIDRFLCTSVHAPFTLALKPVSNRFTFSLNRFGQTTSIRWFTESSFQSTLGAFTQLP